MTYFDFTSTTPVHPEVMKTYQEVLEKYYQNSESLYPSGVKANSLMEKSRAQIAALLSVLPKEIVFTSGGSEANNLAIKGTALKRMKLGKHCITSCVEHSSVMNSFKWLEDYLGFEVTYLPVNQKGSINIEDLRKAMREDTILVSLMYVNNESGAINPLEEIKQIVRKYHNCYLHVDCVQAFGKMNIDLKDVDLASFSAHKIFGLKGSGFLMKKQHVDIAEVISGGQQEGHIRGGTANSPTNIVLGKTVRLAYEAFQANQKQVQENHDYLYKQLESIEHIVLNSAYEATPYLINFSCLTITSQVMMNALANKGFEVSAVSTCDSADAKSRVIEQMYNDENRLKGTIRISISYHTTRQEIDDLLTAIKEIVKIYG